MSAVARLPQHDAGGAVAGGRAIKLDEAAAHQFGQIRAYPARLHHLDHAKRKRYGRSGLGPRVGAADGQGIWMFPGAWHCGAAQGATPQRPVQRDQTSV